MPIKLNFFIFVIWICASFYEKLQIKAIKTVHEQFFIISNQFNTISNRFLGKSGKRRRNRKCNEKKCIPSSVDCEKVKFMQPEYWPSIKYQKSER